MLHRHHHRHRHPGGWWKYDSRSSDEIEKAYRAGTNVIQLMLCGVNYNIDLRDMQQTSSAVPARRRKMKREHATVQRSKGVAGLLNR